jgi:ubiquinone/menaquinone biosynthesis C-methylase UbiE
LVAVVAAPLVRAADDQAKKGDIPPGPQVYMGRRIAQTMHYLGAPWLVREARDREEEPPKLIASLHLKPDMTVCDMGCGNGFYSLRIAKQLDPDKGGKVLAVDIQPEMLELLRKRADAAKITNVQRILGTVIDPKLPEKSCDVILCVDVYHEFDHPEQMLAAMRKALKPDGKVVLVEFRLEDPSVPIKLLHKMSKVQIMKELPANGYKLVREYDDMPWQHVMFFERSDGPDKVIEFKPWSPPKKDEK